MLKNTHLALAIVIAGSLLLSGVSYAHEGSKGMAASHDMKKCMMMMSKTGDADKDFIKNMIPHHQMAIDMAREELKKGKDSEARELAEKIIEAQNNEIKTMQAWLDNKEKERKK